jgi:chorismate dehydratase
MHQLPISIGIVNYNNTLPLLFGLEQWNYSTPITLIKDYPAAIANKFLNNELDIALLPIAILKNIPDAKIISNFCIASKAQVASVCLYAQQSIENLTHIYLDYQSRTSVQLVQYLCKHYWKKEIEFLPAPSNYINEIKDTKGGLIIGDRAFEYGKNFAYKYDLAECWQQHTGLGFVFATWISKQNLSPDFITAFEHANAIGFNNLDTIVHHANYKHYDLQTYFTKNICYKLDDDLKAGMELFLKSIL